MTSNTFMTIAGIDPGYGKMGLAIIRDGARLYSTCLRTPPGIPFADRLLQLGQEVEKILNRFRPDRLAIEKLFFTTNQKTALAVAEARGLVTYLGRKHGLEIAEYTPLQIKQTITGYGRADKTQVRGMVGRLIKLEKKIKEDDEIDAVAIALTDSFIHKLGLGQLQK